METEWVDPPPKGDAGNLPGPIQLSENLFSDAADSVCTKSIRSASGHRFPILTGRSHAMPLNQSAPAVDRCGDRNLKRFAVACLGIACLTVSLGGSKSASAQTPSAQTPIATAVIESPGVTLPVGSQTRPGVSLSRDQTRESVSWLAGQLMLHAPRRIEGDDDWGNTKQVWSGVKVRADGWKIKTHRRQRDLR